jgi:hypothetical protein
MIYIPNFIKTGSGIQKLIGSDSWTYRQHVGRINLFSCRLKTESPLMLNNFLARKNKHSTCWWKYSLELWRTQRSVCTQNNRVQDISVLYKKFCLTSIKLHMVSGIPVLHRVNIRLQKQRVIDWGNAMHIFVLHQQKKKHKILQYCYMLH